jgi:nucleoid-associated protein YgaU
MTTHLAILLATSLVLLSGCDRPTSVATQDARDREHPLIRRALEREQVGDIDGAIQAYEDVLLESPKLVSAHFHLALLQQDYRKDYMGAIYHYRQYERLRPDSEKKALLRDRTSLCQQRLVAQLLNTDDVTISRKQLELVGEIDKLNKRLSVVEGEKAALMEQKDGLDRHLTEQKYENDRLRRLLDRVTPSAANEETRPRSALPRLDPATATLLATPHPAPPPPVARPAPEPETVTEPPAPPRPITPPPAIVPPPPAKTEAPTAAGEPLVTDAPTPTPPASTAATRTYVVQPGDSVYRIAERVYGEPDQWKKIRDANKDRLGPGNQLRAGQVLVIP